MAVYLIIIFYIIGCILSYGRVNSDLHQISVMSKYGLKNKRINTNKFKIERREQLIILVFTTIYSWVGFIVGIIFYFSRPANNKGMINADFFRWKCSVNFKG